LFIKSGFYWLPPGSDQMFGTRPYHICPFSLIALSLASAGQWFSMAWEPQRCLPSCGGILSLLGSLAMHRKIMMLTTDAHVGSYWLYLGFSSLFRHLVYSLLRACQTPGKMQIHRTRSSSHTLQAPTPPTPTVSHRPRGPGAPGT
jgi:hypothetical protein